jgi:zinc finger MIZ domain-containing protein
VWRVAAASNDTITAMKRKPIVDTAYQAGIASSNNTAFAFLPGDKQRSWMFTPSAGSAVLRPGSNRARRDSHVSNDTLKKARQTIPQERDCEEARAVSSIEPIKNAPNCISARERNSPSQDGLQSNSTLKPPRTKEDTSKHPTPSQNTVLPSPAPSDECIGEVDAEPLRRRDSELHFGGNKVTQEDQDELRIVSPPLPDEHQRPAKRSCLPHEDWPSVTTLPAAPAPTISQTQRSERSGTGSGFDTARTQYSLSERHCPISAASSIPHSSRHLWMNTNQPFAASCTSPELPSSLFSTSHSPVSQSSHLLPVASQSHPHSMPPPNHAITSHIISNIPNSEPETTQTTTRNLTQSRPHQSASSLLQMPLGPDQLMVEVWRSRLCQTLNDADLSKQDKARKTVLDQALIVHDMDFLILHQMFCLSSRRDEESSKLLAIPGWNFVQQVLSGVFDSNARVSLGALDFFIDFPLSLLDNTQNSWRHSYSHSYLSSWQRIRAMCEALSRTLPSRMVQWKTQQQFPNMIDLVETFKISSPTLRSSLFINTLISLWDMNAAQTEQHFVGKACNLFNEHHNAYVHAKKTNSEMGWVYFREHVLKRYFAQSRDLWTQYQAHKQQQQILADVTNQPRGARRPSVHTAMLQTVPTMLSNASPTLPSSLHERPVQFVSRQIPAQAVPGNGCSSTRQPHAISHNYSTSIPHHLQSPRNAYPSNAPIPVSYAAPPRSFQTMSQMRPPAILSNPPPRNPALFLRANEARPILATAVPHESALHQVRLLDARTVVKDTYGVLQSQPIYQYVVGYVFPPIIINCGRSFVEVDFQLSEEDLQALPKRDSSLASANLLRPNRTVLTTSYIYRLRSIKWSQSVLPDISSWVVADSAWTPHSCYALNDKILELRKKIHHGKDLPVDISDQVRKTNKLSISAIQTDGQIRNQHVLAVEKIGFMTNAQVLETVKQNAITIDASHTKLRAILDRASDDFEILNLKLRVICPFTSRLPKIPVRSKACGHADCFDLETFLSSRKQHAPLSDIYSKRVVDALAATYGQASEQRVTVADNWKCPICQLDARPSMLAVDEFMVSVIDRLKGMGEDVCSEIRAITVCKDLSWEPYIEAKTGVRSNSPDDDSEVTTPIQFKRTKSVPEVIELDSD